MRALFEEIVRGGGPAVRNLLGRSEEIDFDCKQKVDPTKGTVEKRDKHTLGETLSAFANSIGGLLLWGVDARLNATTGFDEIIGFYPIVDVRRFESELKSLCSDALMPRHAGIEICAIPDDAGAPGTGFVAIWVERSERRPHRNEFGDKYYFRRAGTSSRAMEHFEIEDAFKRSAAPSIQLEISKYPGPTFSQNDTTTLSYGLHLKLRNDSLISSTFPYIMIPSASFAVDTGRQQAGIIQRSEGNKLIFDTLENVVIHPGMTRTIASVFHSITSKWIGKIGTIQRTAVMPRAREINFGCLNSCMQTFICTISTEEFLSIFPNSVNLSES